MLLGKKRESLKRKALESAWIALILRREVRIAWGMRKEKKAFAGGGKRQQQTERDGSAAMYH